MAAHAYGIHLAEFRQIDHLKHSGTDALCFERASSPAQIFLLHRRVRIGRNFDSLL